MASPTLAQWETTNFLPIPNTGIDADDVIEDEFSDFLTTSGSQANPNKLTYDSIDMGALRRGAPAALITVFQILSHDAKKMAVADFPAPALSPLLVSSSGDEHYPIFWQKVPPKLANTDAIQDCDFSGFPVILVNDDGKLSYQSLNAAWVAGGARRSTMLDYVSTTLTHELVHAVQANGGTKWGCNRPSNKKWFTEGTANGIAHYLLSKRVPDALRKYLWARDERSYHRPLYSDNLSVAYDSGSFFRYLIEATEVGGRSDMAIMRSMIKDLNTADLQSRKTALTALDRIVRKFNGDRHVALSLAEFHTEYASYSARYGKSDAYWIHRGFSGCVTYSLLPGVVQTQQIEVARNAARCVKVEWNGFAEATAAQFYLEGQAAADGSLHLGEAIRDHTSLSETWRCYDVVASQVDNRLARPAEEKCMLRRGAQRGLATVNGWTSDFNLFGDGHAYFILTNASEDISASKPLSFAMSVGSNLVKDETGAALKPRRDEKNPVRDGRTLMDSRVHAIAAGPGRVMFDGRSIFGDGIGVGFLEGVSGASEVDAGGTIVRTGDYMIMLVKDKQGVPNQASIMRDPRTNGGKLITTEGTNQTGQVGRCGYSGGARLENLSTSDNKLRFTVSGDLFDFSPDVMMAMAGRELCDIAAATHVEFKSIEVSLPFPEFYDGTIEFTRAYPPMQDIYDELEFRSGPSFGGIATSRSLVLGDGVPSEDTTEQADGTDPGASNRSGGNSSASLEQCTCHCPNIVSPARGSCFNQCAAVLQICPDPDSVEALKADAARYSDILTGRNLSEQIHDMLLSDFETLSGGTRSQIIREAHWD
ncbi:MAG: hypothetical protein AAFR36_24915 [Bacteroidota bacterium]